MNPILKAIQILGGDISNFISPKPVVSPLPAADSPGGYNNRATDPALDMYYQTQTPPGAGPGPSNFQPKTIQYPNSLANAPVGPQQSVMGAAVQQAFPSGATPYEKTAATIFDKHGVPPAIGIGVWAGEGRGKTINPNNPYNIGAYDSDPQNAKAYKFADPIQGTEEAAKFLAGQSDYMAPDKKKIFQQALEQYKKTGDQIKYLQTIAPTFSSNKNYVNLVTHTPEFQRWSYNQ